MLKKLRKVSLAVLSAVLVSCGFAVSACTQSCSGDSADTYDGLFAGNTHSYVLTDDYTLTERDVKGTDGENSVNLGYICSFDLGGHTLNLGGYTLNITSQSEAAVKFENGKIKNGALNISVPNGDIEFTGTDIDKTVTYELEAASETIRFSNANISGKCTVKSNTNVNVEYSLVGDITLSGNGTLTAGDGAELGAVKVGENAGGAKVNVSPSASVSSMELYAAASVSVAGSVSEVKVAEAAKSGGADLSINIEETASVDKVELNAAATVSVAGSVSQVKVAEAAKSGSANLSIDIKETATVDKVELNAAANVSVAGTVQAVTVAEAAKSDSAKLSISVANTAEVARVELNAPASVEVSGGVSNIVVKDTAGGSFVTLTQSANVSTVAVNAADTKIESAENATLSQVVVAASVADKVTSNVQVTTATAEEMNEYLKHQHVFVIISRDDATCTAAGKLHYECDCGEVKETVIPAKGHQYVYTLIKAPTAGEKGRGLYRCIRCGHEYTVEVEYNASVVIEGLEELFSLIPNGTYTISADKKNPVTAAEDGFSITVNEFEAVVEAEDGKLSGTCKGTVTISGEEDEVMTFKAVVDGTLVYVNYSMGSEYGTYEGAAYTALSALIKMGLAELLPFDVEELGELLPYLDNLDNIEVGASALPVELIERLLGGVFDKAEKDGNTVYSLNTEKLLASLTSLGNKTLDTLIDGIVGEGAFKAVEGLADGIADKTVSRVALELFDLAGKFGVSEEELFRLAQTVAERFMPDSEINIEQLIKSYYKKTIAAVVAELTGTTAAQAKQTIETQVAYYLGLCSKTTVADLVTYLLNIDISDNGPVEGNPGISYPDYPQTAAEKEGLTYATLLELLGAYGGNVTVEATVAPDYKLVSSEISYLDENGIKVSIVKNAESPIPVISVDVMGVKVDIDKTENGAQASVEVMGMTFNLNAGKTDTGAEIIFTMDMDEATADATLTITAKKDGNDNICGAEFEISGTVGIGWDDMLDLSGKVTAQKNDNAKLDNSVWDSFDGDKSIYYHMDVTTSEEYDQTTVRLQYVSDASGEYYLLTKTSYEYEFAPGCDTAIAFEVVYKARLLSIDGLPEIMLTYDKDCKDWVELYISHSALAEVTRTPVSFSGVRGESVVAGSYATDFNGSCYYNIKTGKTASESQHKYVYSGKFAEGSKTCSDGIIVTKTCSVCNGTETIYRDYHYFIDNTTILKTQCGERSHIEESECVVCHYKSISCYFSEHSINHVHRDIVTEEEYKELLDEASAESVERNYVKITELAAYGFAVEGFYYGYLNLEHCAVCGLNHYVYTYYTSTQAEGCLEHTARVVEYKGNSGFKGFEYKFENTREKHYASYGHNGEYADVSVAINEVKAVIGGDLIFTPTNAGYSESKCLGCGMTESKFINLYDGTNQLDLYVSFEDGEVLYWSYEGYVYGLQAAQAEAAKYGQSLTGASDGNVRYSVTARDYEVRVYLRDDENSTLTLKVGLYNEYGNMVSTVYNYKECSEVTRSYELGSKGVWGLVREAASERHDFNFGYVYSDNCREDGYYFDSSCRVCGYSTESLEVIKAHDFTGYGSYNTDVHYYDSYLTLNDISELDAKLSFDGRCNGCNTLINATIVLRSNWTLTGDVYIKAEGLTIDLNGYTIDLNGYRLVFYSYAGEALVLTDNTYDTSLEDSEHGVITDSETNGDGLLVLAVANGDILVGTGVVESESFLTDSDDRYSLYNSVLEETGKSILNIKDERPVFPE